MTHTRGRFHQTFSPSEKMPAHGVWRKIRHSISPTIYSKTVKPNLRQKIRQICAPFAKRRSPKKASNFARQKSRKNVDEIDPRGGGHGTVSPNDTGGRRSQIGQKSVTYYLNSR
jgi:hypothetical protein